MPHTPLAPETPRALFRYRFATVVRDQGAGTLTVDGEPAPIERRPLEVLDALLQQAGQVVTKSELLAALWGRDEATVADNVVANAVSKLRSALGPLAGALVLTVPGVGYRLDGRVERTALDLRGALAADLGTGRPVPGREGWLLDRPLGRTAASEVWLARHARLPELRVFKFCHEGERLSALKRETTLYRVLHETLGERDDFARVVDFNFATAPYWLECEFGGLSLGEWLAHTPQAMSWTAARRLALFLRLAHSVADAHAVGVLHKDLKPANVLVYDAAEGQPGSPQWRTRLTDFGSGRVLDSAELSKLNITALGLTVTHGVGADSGSGTLFYMAPEVLAGQAPTVQSDLYALGLILYQWLVGDFRRPMSPGWEDDITDPLLREDLAAATHSQPAQRVSSVAEWAVRLERLNERRAEREAQAQTARRAAQAAETLHRNRARRPWLLALVASLVLGLGVSLGFYRQSRLALADAVAQAERADAINAFLNEDLLQSADLSRVGRNDKLTMTALLQRASDKAGPRFVDRPATEASVREQLAMIFSNMNALPQADAEFQRALALLKPLHGARDERVLILQLKRSQTLSRMSKFDEAQALIRAASRDADPAQLAGETELAYAAARAAFNLASLRHEGEAASMSGERALDLQARLHPKALTTQAMLRGDLADHYWRVNRPAKARQVLEVALKPPFTDGALSEVELQRLRIRMARILKAEVRTDEAIAILRDARDRIAAVLGPDDAVVASASSDLGSIHAELGRFDLAVAEVGRAHAAMLRTLGPEHQTTRMLSMNLGILQLNQGDAAAALTTFDGVRAWAAQTFGGDSAAMVQAIDYYRAQALNDLGRAAAAAALLKPLQATALAQLSPAPDWPYKLAGQRGRSLSLLGRHAQALPMLTEAVSGMEKAGTAAWIVMPLRADLARSQAALGGKAASADR